MSPKDAPIIYIFHGDDEYAIWREVKELKQRLGESMIAELNTITLDGSSITLEELQLTACAIPFFNERRLVILHHPLAMIRRGINKDRFLTLLMTVPQSTALLLIEEQPLTTWQMKRDRKIHWLEEWALQNTSRAYLKELMVPRGSALVQWVMDRAAQRGGHITRQAADALVRQIGEDNRILDLELTKLLEFVDYARDIEVDDVERLTTNVRSADIFALTDAIGNKNRKLAIELFHDLLAKNDPIHIMGMVVRHFRNLILVKECLSNNFSEKEILSKLNLRDFVVRKLVNQARLYTQKELDAIYRKLLEVDVLIKSSQLDLELAIDLLIVDGLPGSYHFVPLGESES